MIAAFVDDEQRGVGVASEVPVFLGNGYAFLMMVYSNATGGESMTFKYYDSGDDCVLDNYNDYENNGSVTSKVYADGVANSDGVLDNFNDYENNGSVTAKVYADGAEVGAFVDGFY